MKTYSIGFSHPVSGKIFMTHSQDKEKHVLDVSSDSDNVVKISLEGIKKGKWDISFEWEHDNQEFTYTNHIDVT